MAGGRFNSNSEVGYAPVERELLGIASALHKTRYFVSEHPNVTVIKDHKPILNLLQDRTRTIHNKRLTNLRRKCDGFIFQTGYGRGIDNTSDAISRIKEWSKIDKDRMDSVDDHKDINDDSIGVNANELINKTDLEEVSCEVNNLDLNKNSDRANLSSALLGSWHTTPRSEQLRIMLEMYGNGEWDADDNAFSASIRTMDANRDFHYSSKIDVKNDLDKIYSDHHRVCEDSGFGHSSNEGV